MMKVGLGVMGLAAVMALTGCKSAYYGAMEKVGVHKRDILVDRVEEARNSQVDAKETFKSALELFSEVVDIHSSGLEEAYNKFSKAYEKSVGEADKVNSRVASIESVSKSLFKEWKSEIKEYQDPSLRKASEKQLKESQARYTQMIKAMKGAAASMDPVLAAFHDQVLFLKHNLNSAAIASLDNEVVRIQGDVSRLISDMEAAIAEADAFLASWPGGGK